jgi:hypothetical protein
MLTLANLHYLQRFPITSDLGLCQFDHTNQMITLTVITLSGKWPPLYISLMNRYKGRLFDKCITLGNFGSPWCPTEVDPDTLEASPTKRGSCPSTCAVNDCPIGFQWIVAESSCYRVKYRFFGNHMFNQSF